MKLSGYENLGLDTCEGKCYAWELNTKTKYVESAAFTNHRKNDITNSENICGYTSSVSSGCILKSMKAECKFCRTGNTLPFTRILTSEEIAKENILMVLIDINFPVIPKVKFAAREFAYMGQGEPGYSYTQLRKAIRITNYAMKVLKQKTHRHIISTCGIPEMINNALFDIQNQFFDERITFHFSLHLTNMRDLLMPINKIYNYKIVLNELYKVKNITGEKPCIGILLFPKFSPLDKSLVYSNNIMNIENILKELDPSKVRLSFSELNVTNDIGKSKHFDENNIKKIINLASAMGFESKYFSSFGQKEYSACGMLGGKKRLIPVNENIKKLETEADLIIKEAMDYFSEQQI